MIGTKTPFSVILHLHDAFNTIVTFLILLIDTNNNVKDMTGAREWGQCHATRGDMVPCKKEKEKGKPIQHIRDKENT